MKKGLISVILFLFLLPTCLCATTIDSINVCTVSTVNHFGIPIAEFNFTIIVKVSDPLGVPGNIQSVTAVGLNRGDTYELVYSYFNKLGEGDYRNFVWNNGQKEYPGYNLQTGIYKITVVNKQGETTEKFSYSLTSTYPLPVPQNLWIKNDSPSASRLSYNPVYGANWYFYQIFDPYKFAIHQSNYSSTPDFTINQDLMDPSQIYYIMAGADAYLVDNFGELQRRSANTMLYSPKKRIFGLFVGTWGRGNYRADLMAEQLGNAFLNNVVGEINRDRVKILKGDSINAEGLRPEDIQKAINEFNLKTGDSLFIYIAGHGNSFRNENLPAAYLDEGNGPNTNPGDEFIILGKEAADPRTNNLEDYKGYLTDDQLTSYLRGLNDINKWVFLDVCHSGGFWGMDNVSDSDGGDLSKLKKISLITSATELGDGVYDGQGTGLPYFGKALLEGMELVPGQNGYRFRGDLNRDGLDFEDLKNWLTDKARVSQYFGTYVNRTEFPDDFWNPVVFTEELWNPQGYKSADFNAAIDEITLETNLVEIDISPGEFPNPLDLRSGGALQVAVKTTATFDARAIEKETICFADAKPIFWSLEDVDGDGVLDLLLKFNIGDLNLDSKSSSATLVARTINGTGIQGSDEVWLMGFDDVAYEHWAYQYIRGIFNAGITTGCSQDNLDTPENEAKYCPDDPVTREQMAKFILSALNEVPPDGYCGTTSPFWDVEHDRWSCKYIKRLAELKITTGYEDGSYHPGESISREQMAVFITRAINEVPADGYCGVENPFTDVSFDRWSCKYVKRFQELGITTGYGDGRYGPLDPVIRGQMAVFLSRAFLGM